MLAADSRRPYDQVIHTACGACPAGCGVKFYVKDGRVVDLLGDETHPVNRGALCARGSAFFQHFNHPARLRQPALRHALDQDFSPCGWDEALNFAAGRLKAVIEAHGSSAVAVVASAGLDVGNRIGAAQFAARLGAQVLSPTQSPSDVVAAAMFGPEAAPFLTVPPDEWMRGGCLLLLGGDPAVEYPVAFRHVLEARSRQIPVIAVAPRHTATLSKADFAFQIRPGSEAVFLLALAKVAFEEGLPDSTFEMCLAGLDKWRAAGDLSWEDVERLTWLPEASVRRAGLVWMAHQPGVIIGGGVVSPNTARAAAGLLAINGRFPFAPEGGKGGGWNWLAEPPWPFLLGRDASPGAHELAPLKAVVGTGNFWPRLEAGGSAQMEFVAHFGAYPDEAQRRAHVSFPAASWAEVEGLHVSHDRRVQRHMPVVAPPGQARAALEFWVGLADRLGLGDAFPWRTSDGRLDFQAFAQSLLDGSPLVAGSSLGELNAVGGTRWPCRAPSESDPLSSLSLGSPPEITIPEIDPARPLLLCRDVPAEGDATWWPWLHVGDPLQGRGEDTTIFQLHPTVAAALGLENDDALMVDDGQRRYQGRARLTHAVPMRTIWASGGAPLVASALVFRQQDHVVRSLARLRVLFAHSERQA